MVDYQDFVALTQSGDTDARGEAAHLAAHAYLNHHGPADEHAALYAALIGFLEDPSVRVRGALAYGLLHAPEAPRPILLALLQDSPVIARAIVQNSPALIDADVIGIIRTADRDMLEAASLRPVLSERCCGAIVARAERAITIGILRRHDVSLARTVLEDLARGCAGDDAELRGALLGRADLPPQMRLILVDAVTSALRGSRLISGAVTPPRLERLLRNSLDTALTGIGEREAEQGRAPYAAGLAKVGRISVRVLLHAVISGHVLFFATCVSELSEMPERKVFSVLETGGRPALNALLARCGLGDAVRNLIVRLIIHARNANLADDVAARHFVVTALTEELIVEHDGLIPSELEEAFAYLSEQNVALARKAARGVMMAFAASSEDRKMQTVAAESKAALPAA